jgi:hypothetical protein
VGAPFDAAALRASPFWARAEALLQP